MQSRRFNVAVIMLWVATMTWLVWNRVLPSLLVGEPPNVRTILKAQRGDPPIGWKINWDQHRLGWAVSVCEILPNDITEVSSRVHLDELPSNKTAQTWIEALLGSGSHSDYQIPIEITTTRMYDAMGQFAEFSSSLRFHPEADSVVRVDGVIEEGQLVLTFNVGANSEFKQPVKQSSMLSGLFTPHTRLPGLRSGQTWTVAVNNPLQVSGSPVEILRATVDGKTPIHWQGRTVDTWLVIYYRDSGSGADAEKPCGRIWVRRDGVVLRQEVEIFGSTLQFTRQDTPEAERLAEIFRKEETRRRGKRMIDRRKSSGIRASNRSLIHVE